MNKKQILRVAFLGCLVAAISGCAGLNHRPARFQSTSISNGRFFAILPWDPNNRRNVPITKTQRLGLESMAECNFNLAGFVFPRELATCERLGLGAILLPSEQEFTSFKYSREWRSLSDDEIDRRVKSMVAGAGSSPAVAGFFIMDEPGVKDFPALAKAVAAVKKYAPGQLAYINLYPDYAVIGDATKSRLGTDSYTNYLERFVAEVKPQLLSYDYYQVETSMDLADSAKAASYYQNLLEIRRVAQKHHLPFLNVVVANQIRPFTTPPSPANLQFQAYTSLAAGSRGVAWFTYYEHGYHYAPVDAAGRKTLTWAWLREVNREVATLAPVLSRLTSTGVYFSKPNKSGKQPELPGKLIESIECAEPLMIGEFEGDSGAGYAMIVNLSLERSAKFKPKTVRPDSAPEIVSAMDGSLSAYDAKQGLWLTAGQGVLLRFGR
jgi:hypothetical protein